MPRIETWLAGELPGFDAEPWYVGRPLLVTENDHAIRLYNGDTGVVVTSPTSDRPTAAFERQGEIVYFSPSRLAAVDTVYAMTVHKSQGSQFDTAAVLLPDPASPILTRELLYTAVTRAQEKLILAGTEEAIRAAVERPIARASGLRPPAVGLTTADMIEGIPGTPFEDEVLIRRRRWASDETGFAIIDADRAGDEIVLVGTIAHLEERERVRISGQWQDDRRYGLQVKVATAEPLAPTGEAALLVYLKRVRHVGGRRAERLLDLYGEDVLEVIDRDPPRRLPPPRSQRRADHRGGQVLGRAALQPSPPPPARTARPRVAGRAHREALRPARPPHRARAPVRPHERVRDRLPDGGHDRALRRRRRPTHPREHARACSTS